MVGVADHPGRPGLSSITFRRSPVPDPDRRVLWVTNMWPDPERPHYGTFIRSQARSLEAAGVAVDALILRGYASGHAYLLAPRATRSCLERTGYALVHIHTGHAAFVSLARVNVPTVISFVGADLLGQPRANNRITAKSYLESRSFRHLGRFADATITKSHEMELRLPEALRPRNSVIPNGVELQPFAPQDKRATRAALGWDPDEPVVLFLGNPRDPRKNVALLDDAAQILRRQIPRLRVHRAWGSPPEEVPALMWAADCLAVPSLSEGSPNVVKEAMAAALPVVACPAGDVRERLAGVPGTWVVEYRDGAAGFADALAQAIRLDRAPAARVAVASLSVEAVAQQVIDVYDAVSG